MSLSPSALQGDSGESRGSTPPDPFSPFDVDGLCRHCRGQGEHTAWCVYARRWERFGGGL